MTERNLNPYTFFERTASRHVPRYVGDVKTKQAFDKWKKALLPKVLASLGQTPTEVPARPQLLAEWEEECLIKQRWVIDVQPELSAIVLVFRPAELAEQERRPAILCCHGHGTYGKDSVMGVADAGRAEEIRRYNYDYGRQMALSGFVTFSLDWLGFGERDSRRKPAFRNDIGDRDPCNVHYLCATMLGTTVLGMNCHDGSRAIDLVCTLPFVDPKRLGVMGLSFGGTMTTWMMLTDKRLRAADIICYAGPFYDIAYRTYNVCGSQVTPGLYDLCDTPELQGLIAPKPLLVEIGIHDTCFHVDHTFDQHYKRLARIYKASGASDRLELDLFPGEHSWGANRSVAFFRNSLGS